MRWLCRKHPRTGWRVLCRRWLPGWRPTEGKVTLFDPGTVAIRRYRYRGAQIYPTEIDFDALERDSLDHPEFEAMLLDDAERAYRAREDELGPDLLAELERWVLLTVLDQHWRQHLNEMETLSESAGLLGIGRYDPFVEYQREGFDMFQAMQESIKLEVVAYVFNASVEAAEQAEESRQAAGRPRTQLSSAVTEAEQAAATQAQQRSGGREVGRNQPCPCGSGKKYKLCHGRPSDLRLP
jgi:preprotein translocase subunit SecA